MNQLSVAIALQSGEMVSPVIELIDKHPFLDFYGAARSIPDLIRLLERFQPHVLLLSPSILEDLASTSISSQDAQSLSKPLSFLLCGSDSRWEEKDLAKALRQPLQCCGLINMNDVDGEELFHLLKEKVALFSSRAQPAFTDKDARKGREVARFILLTGCKGGVGASLISCSLSAALASSGRRILLMDMDHDLSQLLHIKARGEGKDLLELLPMAEEISWDLIRVSIYKHPSGFYVLPYGMRPFDGPDVDGSLHGPFLRNMLFLFDIVVMDFPRALDRDFLSLLHHAPTVILVSLPDTLSANCARRKAAFIRRTGLERSHVRLLLNRCGSHHVLRPEELARAAGIDLLACIPEDAASGMDFAELGEIPPLDSALGRATRLMAASMGFEVALVGKARARRRPKALREHYEQGVLEDGRS